MRIALYVPSWPPGRVANGIVSYAGHLVPALRALGHEVFVLTHHSSEEPDAYTVDLQRYSGKSSIWLRAVSKISPVASDFRAATLPIISALTALVDKKKIDVFEMEESFGWSDAISGLGLLPVVVRLHGPWFMNGRFDPARNYSTSDFEREKREGLAIKNANYVTAPSHDVLRSVHSHYHHDLTSSDVIPNPIMSISENERWNLEDCDHDSFLFVGRFDEIKGGDLVIRAFDELCRHYSNLRLTFVGPDIGVRDEKKSLVKFQQFAQTTLSKEVLPRVSFRGKLDGPEIGALRPKHFVTLCAAQMEIFPYSVLEPMSYGCPIVASAVGGVPEMIHADRNGLTFPSQDLSSLISACRRLINDRQLATRLGYQAWQDCRDHYAANYIAQRTVAAYEKAIKSFNLRNEL